MQPPSSAVLVLALVLGGCAAPDESLPPEPLKAPTALATSSIPPSSSTSTVTTVTSTSTSSTTTTTITMAPTTTSTLPVSPLVLRSDGLGIVEFGDPVEDVMATLTDLFGKPSYDQLLESPFELDEGWTGPNSGTAACHWATVPVFGGHICFDYIRVTSWSDVGLSVVFSDLMVAPGSGYFGDSADYVEVPPSLRGYVYRAGDAGPSARTVEGISVGSTVEDLTALGDQVTFSGPVRSCP